MADPNKPRLIDPRVSIGNLLAIVAMIGGMVAGWYGLKQQLALTEERMAVGIAAAQQERIRIEQRVAKIETERDDVRERLIRVEILLQQIAERLGASPHR